MKRVIYIIGGLLLIVACSSRKSGSFDVHRPPPPPDGMHPDGPPPPPPHGKGRPPHKTDNMRGFDPASEDDMEDNGMSRYIKNNDEEGWD